MKSAERIAERIILASRWIGDDVSFGGNLNAGSLKIKVASAIVAISSIHLLQIFLNAPHYDNEKIMWATIVHLAFVASALILGFLEQIMSKLE